MLTAQQKYIQLIVSRNIEHNCLPDFSLFEICDINNPEEIDKYYKEDKYGNIYDTEAEVKEGDYKTDIPCEWSRHYETESVAVLALDKSYIGWTRFFGGGKHSEPEAIDIEPYDLDCHEESKMMIVRAFSKKPSKEVEDSSET